MIDRTSIEWIDSLNQFKILPKVFFYKTFITRNKFGGRKIFLKKFSRSNPTILLSNR